MRFDLAALTGSASALAAVPLFLLALLVVRGLPAAVYLRVLGRREAFAAGLLQATSLPFLVTAAAIGRELDLIGAGEGAALVGAGLLSVLLFPAAGLALLRRSHHDPKGVQMNRQCSAYSTVTEAEGDDGVRRAHVATHRKIEQRLALAGIEPHAVADLHEGSVIVLVEAG